MQAYDFLDTVLSKYEEKDFYWLANHYSKQVLDYYNIDVVKCESNLRTKVTNNDPDFKKINLIVAKNNAAYGIVVGEQNKSGDKKYYEDNIYAFKEDGEWVFCFSDEFYNAKAKTEPETREELLKMYPELEQESDITETTVETITQEHTEMEADTTTEAPAGDQTEKPSEENGEGGAVSESVSCLGGTVIVELDSYDATNNIVTLKVTNNNDMEITTFGLPTAVIDGKSVALNDFDNMSSHSVVIQPGSFTTIEYVIDGAFFDHGGKINGKFHILNPSLNDCSYSLEISF